MGAKNLHNLVFEAAKEILADGQYPTINLICKKLGLNPTEIENVLSIKPLAQPQSDVQTKQQEMVEALTLLTKLDIMREQQTDVITNNNTNHTEAIANSENTEDEEILPNHVKQMAARVDKKAQYMAAAELVLTEELYRYYRKTQRFSQPEIKQEVENALQNTENSWEDDIQNFSPAVILKKYSKSIR